MRLTCRASLAMFVLACCAVTTGALAQDRTPRARLFLQTAISPDGTRVAWVEETVNSDRELTGSAIFIQNLKSSDSKPQRISAVGDGASASENTIAWAPDGKRLAFLSDAGGREQPQFYVADLDGRSVRRITNLTGSLAAPAWSPDGKTLAFLFTENAPRADPLMPMAEETGVIADKVYEQRLAVVDVASDKIRQLSPPDMYVYEYDWAPDGKSFAAIAAHGAGDANWYVAQLYTVGSEGGAWQPVYKPKLQIAVPRWSPDGQSIAFIEGLMSDEGFTGGDIYVVSKTGGEARDVTPGIAASPAAIYWRSLGNISFTEDVDGQVGISAVDLTNGKISSLWTGSGVITDGFRDGTAISLSADARNAAAIRHSWEHPPEVWAGPVGDWKQLTHSNSDIHPAWGEMKSLYWTDDGMKIQGWLMYPKDYDPARHYPMVVDAHGGPAGTAHTGWPEDFFDTFELSAHGYFVFYPNPRGSFGQGENFTKANVKDFGYGDFRDIMAGVDEVVRTVPVDGNRVGITGWSYGGYMTMWAVTQTNRFRAAVAGAGLANWQSYYGENDIDEWMIPYFGASVYDDPAIYARSAPMTFIKNVKTPTLLLVGERDGECPAPQSREFWHALKTLRVETELVIYPGEGHVFNQPDNERDVMMRLIQWFDHYLKSDNPSANIH